MLAQGSREADQEARTQQQEQRVVELGHEDLAGQLVVVIEEIADGGEGQADGKPAPGGPIGARGVGHAEPGNDRRCDISDRPMQAVEEVRNRRVRACQGENEQDADGHARKDHGPCSETPGIRG